MKSYEKEKYLDWKKKMEFRGMVTALVCLVVLMLDATTPFPTPVRGQFAFVWLIPILGGLYCWLLLPKLVPVKEIRKIAWDQKGEIHSTDLVDLMDVDPDESLFAMEFMERKKHCVCEDREGQKVFVFKDIREKSRSMNA